MGAVLAGGVGRRLGGDKAMAMLGGRRLIAYPVAAMAAVVADVTIIAKPDTVLPPAGELGGVRVLREPAEPRHPLVGIVHALRAAGGRPVLLCPADLPLVTSAVLAALASADPRGAPAVVAIGGAGRGVQPLLGCYRPEAAELLDAAAREAVVAARAAVAAIGAREVAVPADVLVNVNTAEDLVRVEALLASRR
jgi:molybdopterin-guanine dinucleotide biosynthesis protein A